MPNVSGPTYQPSYAAQPSFVAGNETKANTEKVQPRSAPAADSQRADKRAQESRDERRAQSADESESRAEAVRASEDRAEAQRGSRVDVTV